MNKFAKIVVIFGLLSGAASAQTSGLPGPNATSSTFGSVKPDNSTITVSGGVISSSLPYVTPEQYGALGNGSFYFDGAVTSGTASISSATAGFTSGEVGDPICVAGAASGGGQMCGTISSFTSATVVGLSFTPTATGSSLQFDFGTNDTTAFTNMLTTAPCSTVGCKIQPANKMYILNASLTLPSSVAVQISGAGPGVPNTANNYEFSSFVNKNTGTRLAFLTKSLSSAAINAVGVNPASDNVTDLIEHLAVIAGAGVARDGGGADGIDIINWQGFALIDDYVFNFTGNGVYEDVTTGYMETLVNDRVLSSYNGGVGIQIGSSSHSGFLETVSVTNSILEGNGLQGLALASPGDNILGFTLNNSVVQWNNVITAGTEVAVNNPQAACMIYGNYFEVDTHIGSKSTAVVNNAAFGCNWQSNTLTNTPIPGISSSETGVIGTASGNTLDDGSGNIKANNELFAPLVVASTSVTAPSITSTSGNFVADAVSGNYAAYRLFNAATSATQEFEMLIGSPTETTYGISTKMGFYDITHTAMRAAIDNAGNFNVGYTTPYPTNFPALFSVGTGGQFQVNGSGDVLAPLVQLANTAQPTCSSTTAGTINYVQGNSTTKDTVSVCAHDASNVYAWRTIY